MTPAVQMDLGTFMVYTIVDNDGVPLFYWNFSNQLKTNGPFPSLRDALIHYNAQQNQTLNPENVIKVDFVTKKRISAVL